MGNNFSGDLIVMQLGPGRWRVYETFTYRVGSPDGEEFVRIGKGLETDFASIPRPLWILWPPADGAHSKPAVVHDCLYKTGYLCHENGSDRDITRKEADDIFYEAMGVTGVGWFSRRLIYAGVRSGGWIAWGKHRKDDDGDSLETVE